MPAFFRSALPSGHVEPYLTHRYSESFHGCNDLVFASNGDLYFTDQGQSGLHQPDGRVFRYTAAGKLECLLSNGPSPNGLLVVAHAGNGSVWIFDRLGAPVYRVRATNGLLTTNVAYGLGSEDGQHLYITESDSGSILRARLDVPGDVMFAHR